MPRPASSTWPRSTERLQAGDCFETAMRWAYRAALCSPDFLYHVEPAGKLDDHALACRLSYFFWRSMPDEKLTQLADAGRAARRRVLAGRDANGCSAMRSRSAFIEDFLGQWLKLRLIAATDPDRKLYPEFSPYLQDSMVGETRAYFRELLDRGPRCRPSGQVELRHAEREAGGSLRHSGSERIANSPGGRCRPVVPRGPFLTQASILKITANGTTTSPVPRGAFVMDRLLGQPPEPPPPNIPAIEPDVRGAKTIREQLDKHRSVAACASCHAKMDPPGFALESFDVIGGFRTRYRSIGAGDPAPRGSIDPFIGISFKLGPPVDASGVLPDGQNVRRDKRIPGSHGRRQRPAAQESCPPVRDLRHRTRCFVQRPRPDRRRRCRYAKEGGRHSHAHSGTHTKPTFQDPMMSTHCPRQGPALAGAAGSQYFQRTAMKKGNARQAKFLHSISHKRIDPPALTGQTTLPQMVEEAFLSYNAGRLREACKLFTAKMLAENATVGLALSGALTPAGLGISCLVPLIEAGFIDWIISTGANLYHDTHFALGMDMHQSRPGLDDLALRKHQVIRIYDIVFDYENLLGTDRFYRQLCRGEAFQKTLGTAEFHNLAGKYLAAREDETMAAARESPQEASLRAGGGLSLRRADLHLLAGRQLHRHEPGGAATGRLGPAHRSAARRQPKCRHRLGREDARGRAASSFSAAARPRISCCKRSRKFRKCSASTRAATTISCK